jgi:restriction endonuclease Mrr
MSERPPRTHTPEPTTGGAAALLAFSVDGDELARLMIEHGVGTTVRQTYELKRVDEAYFAAINA